MMTDYEAPKFIGNTNLAAYPCQRCQSVTTDHLHKVFVHFDEHIAQAEPYVPDRVKGPPLGDIWVCEECEAVISSTCMDCGDVDEAIKERVLHLCGKCLEGKRAADAASASEQEEVVPETPLETKVVKHLDAMMEKKAVWPSLKPLPLPPGCRSRCACDLCREACDERGFKQTTAEVDAIWCSLCHRSRWCCVCALEGMMPPTPATPKSPPSPPPPLKKKRRSEPCPPARGSNELVKRTRVVRAKLLIEIKPEVILISSSEEEDS